MQVFREGASLRIRRKGFDRFTATIDLPADSSGLLGRECPEDECAPGYFKVKTGPESMGRNQSRTVRIAGRKQIRMIFATAEQVRYAQETLKRHAVSEMNRAPPRALGMGLSGRRTIGAGLFSRNLS